MSDEGPISQGPTDLYRSTPSPTSFSLYTLSLYITSSITTHVYTLLFYTTPMYTLLLYTLPCTLIALHLFMYTYRSTSTPPPTPLIPVCIPDHTTLVHSSVYSAHSLSPYTISPYTCLYPLDMLSQYTAGCSQLFLLTQHQFPLLPNKNQESGNVDRKRRTRDTSVMKFGKIRPQSKQLWLGEVRLGLIMLFNSLHEISFEVLNTPESVQITWQSQVRPDRSVIGCKDPPLGTFRTVKLFRKIVISG